MPVIRTLKPEGVLREQFEVLGPCVKAGMEIWEVSRINVRVGILEKISGGNLYIRRPEGLVIRSPLNSLLFTLPTGGESENQ